MKTYNLFLMFVILSIFSITLASASFLDSKQDVQLNGNEAITIGGKTIEYNKLWEKYQPIEIKGFFGLGATLFSGAITKHTELCGSDDCSSTINIYSSGDNPLIDDIRFYNIDKDGYETLEQIRGYQLYVQDGETLTTVDDYEIQCNPIEYINGSAGETCKNVLVGDHFNSEPIWSAYSIGERLPEGDYVIKLEGHKNPLKTIDWQIKTQGKWITEWSTWGPAYGSIVNDLSLSEATGGGDATSCDGIEIIANKDIVIVNATLSSGATGNECRMIDAIGGSIIETGILSNGFCLFSQNITLSSGNTRAICIAGATSYKYSNGQPASSGTNLNFTGNGCYGNNNCVNLVPGQPRAIVSVASKSIINGSVITANAPANNITFAINNITFNASATVVGGATLVNMSLLINSTGTFKINQTKTRTGVSNSTTFNVNLSSGTYLFGFQACDTDGACGVTSNRTFNIDINVPIVQIYYPNGTIPLASIGQNFTLNYTASDASLQACWYNYNNINVTINCALNTTFTLLSNQQTITVFANDSLGNVGSYNSNWTYNILENSTNFITPIIEGENNNINSTFILNSTPTSIYLNYNGTLYVPTITTSTNVYTLNSQVISPSVSSNSNISFYYSFLVNGSYFNTSASQQAILNIQINTTCGAGSFSMLNISNYDEELLTQLNGTVEYTLNLINNNLEIVALNGSNTGTNIQFCSSQNLSSSFAVYALELRYYKTGYAYETYNIQASSVSNLPVSIPLYFLNSTIGTQFKINYVDYYYIKHPGALVQVQRQYLSDNTYKVVEIPKIGDNGQSQGTFNANNIRYKLLILEEGSTIDTFDNVFPLCQNLVLGTCELNLRGSINQTVTTTGDFEYTLVKTNNTIILTYNIPSGTPKSIEFVTNQSSRFMDSISGCDTSLFASGGTITCGYNNTVGDSIVDIHIITNGANPLYGSVLISEDLSGYYLLNNYIIAFVMLLTLALIFISSGMMMVVSAVAGILFLGLIFLLKGASLGTVATSLMWLIIGAVLIIYKISQKEEK